MTLAKVMLLTIQENIGSIPSMIVIHEEELRLPLEAGASVTESRMIGCANCMTSC